MARTELKRVRNSWSSILESAKTLASAWNVNTSFKQVRTRHVKTYFDELCSDERLQNPEEKIRVTIFNVVLDVALSQLDQRFTVTRMFSFIQPTNLVSYSNEKLLRKVGNFMKVYGTDMSEDCDLENEIRQFSSHFKDDILKMKSVTEILQKLQNMNLIPSFPGLTNVCVLFMSLPVTVASAERSFSKLKIIKNYLRSRMAQDRLDELAMISIENEEAKQLNVDDLIDKFAEKNARRKQRFAE